MNDAVKTMLNRYRCSSVNDHENALKEIIQEIALLGLWRAKFFEKAAFYGGSALRILYGLDRFSEDLDFSLLKSNLDFSLTNYCRAVEEELTGFGLSVVVESKVRIKNTNIDSAFIKAGTLMNMLMIEIPKSIRKKVHYKKVIKIRLEIDKDPPADFRTEAKYIFQPVPFSANTYILSHLFAGKMHAVLCRAWETRVKGRDWYDLIWFTTRKTPVGLKHLEQRMKQTGHLEQNETLTEKILKQKLMRKIDSVDFKMAVKDVENMLKYPSSLKIWSKDFFRAVCAKIRTIE